MEFGIRPEDLGSEEAEQQKDAPKITAKVEVVEPDRDAGQDKNDDAQAP